MALPKEAAFIRTCESSVQRAMLTCPLRQVDPASHVPIQTVPDALARIQANALAVKLTLSSEKTSTIPALPLHVL